MSDWKMFLYGAFVISFVAGIYRLLCKNKGVYEKQMQFAAGLLSVALFCVPAFQNGLDLTLPDFQYQENMPSQEGTFDQVLLQESRTQLQAHWQGHLEKKFGLKSEEYALSVTVRMQEDTVMCHAITVLLSKKDSYMKEDIESYLQRYADCKISVIIEEGSS